MMPTSPKPNPGLGLTVDRLRPPKRGPVKPKGSGGGGGGRYTVKRGDTLSAIAKRNGTTLAAIFRLNPKLKSNPKYQGGNRIFAGTKVRLK